MGEDGVHAGQGARLADVDALDQGVGVGAVEQHPDQHPAHLQVVGEGRVALHELERVDLRLRLSQEKTSGLTAH